MSYISASDAAAMAQYWRRRGVFFRLGSNPPLRLWLGFGDIAAPMRAVSAGAEIYQGGGLLAGDVQELAQLLNGSADRATFTLSGLDEPTLQLIDASAPAVAGSSLHVGIMCFNDAWQPATDLIAIARLTADYVGLRYTGAQFDQPAQAAIELTAHYGDAIAHTKPALIYWTPTHQKRRDASDTSCDSVFTYQSSYQVKWPLF